MLEISLKPELLLSIGGLQLTNSLFSTFLVFLVITITLLAMAKNFSAFNPSKAQLTFELIVEALGKVFSDIAEHT
jgi:F0F1-type ATP synthase membrane subunit a